MEFGDEEYEAAMHLLDLPVSVTLRSADWASLLADLVVAERVGAVDEDRGKWIEEIVSANFDALSRQDGKEPTEAARTMYLGVVNGL